MDYDFTVTQPCWKLSSSDEFYPIFILDGESAGTKVVGFNRMQFLLESLQDVDNQLRRHGGKLYLLRGSPVNIFKRMWEQFGLQEICFEQDPEAIWYTRDETVKQFCYEHGIQCEEHVSHTLWDPHLVIETNGGMPPLTYQMFLVFSSFPTPQDFGLFKDENLGERMVRWVGGETHALQNLSNRLKVEETAFRKGYFLPNSALPDLLGPPTSLSPAL